ncbi:serine hydrolase [Microbulbifer halophilus]|uniref:Serine hydrolase n=1 Tax=Microbulbifer halophilus TaxID=453963 RepID=A0ABW5EGH8_9GAMM|nr:serine hydrolase [Microbulbifer halophilus]MCW8126987.1 serine hydrolase [Microbulbifer halophilus]
MQTQILAVLVALLLAACSGPADAAGEDAESLVARVLEEERVPGAAVGIWHRGEPVLLRGFGVTNVDRPRPVDAQTQFKLASTTKAFTTAALALLVEEGKLQWDGRVVDYLPAFQMGDPWITREFRVEDLLTHRSGLGAGAGDLMLWPQPNQFTREDVLAGLKYLPITKKFRADYAYDNLLYIIAGELIEAVSGQTYEDFVQQRLLAKLELEHCSAGPVPEAARDNLADPHRLEDGQLVVDTPNLAGDEPIVLAAAGGMHCSAGDMLRWLRTLLAGGVTPEGERIFSEQTRDRLWKPVTLMPLSDARAERDAGHFYAYALGWRVQDMHGKRVIHHTGSLSGMYAWTALVPEEELALVVLMNRSAGVARQSLIYGLLKPYLGAEPRDWLAYFQDLYGGASEPSAPERYPHPQVESPVGDSALPGRYRDPWFGPIEIDGGGDTLRWRSLKSSRLAGSLARAAPGVWSLRWDDRSLEADAWLMAERDAEDKLVLTLQPQSRGVDFSYDFQDLRFERVRGEEQQ